jgi:hypothetical protein
MLSCKSIIQKRFREKICFILLCHLINESFLCSVGCQNQNGSRVLLTHT